MTVLQRLKNHLDTNKIKVTTFSRKTGIEKDRVYKWLKKENLDVRLDRDDEKKILDFLENGIVSNNRGSDQQENEIESSEATVQTLARSVELAQRARLMDARNRRIEAENRRAEIESRRVEARNVERLINMLEQKLGVETEANRMELPRPGAEGTRTYNVSGK